VVANGCLHVFCLSCWQAEVEAQLETCRVQGWSRPHCGVPDCQLAVDQTILDFLGKSSREVLQFNNELRDLEVLGQLAKAGNHQLVVSPAVASNAIISQFAVKSDVGQGIPASQDIWSLCAVCCEERVGLITGGQCSHLACLTCWLTWAHEKLPTCRLNKQIAFPCFACEAHVGDGIQRMVIQSNHRFALLEEHLVRRKKLQASPLYPAELQIDCPDANCVGLGYLGGPTVMCFICEHQWTASDPVDANYYVLGATVKHCPKCGVMIEKNGGCDHMTCQCRHQFWWSTLKPYP